MTKSLEETNCNSCGKSFTLFDFLTIRDTCLECVIEQDEEEDKLAREYEERVFLVENGESKSFVVESAEEIFTLIDKEESK